MLGCGQSKKALGAPPPLLFDLFLVLQKNPKYFLLSIKNKQVNISVDKLKPAYVLQSNERMSPENVHLFQVSSDHINNTNDHIMLL